MHYLTYASIFQKSVDLTASTKDDTTEVDNTSSGI